MLKNTADSLRNLGLKSYEQEE